MNRKGEFKGSLRGVQVELKGRMLWIMGCVFALAMGCVFALLTSCQDEATMGYSTKYRVQFFMETPQAPDLHNTMVTPGRYISIRQGTQSRIRLETPEGSVTEIAPSAVAASSFYYGLGGLIVGNTYTGEAVAYDLSCPTCDRQQYRLTITNDGYATCSHCATRYDLNNYGVITETAEEKPANLRGLYRYRIVYTYGTSINVYN